MLHHIVNDTRGATAIEYGLIAAGIALTISGAVWLFGEQLYDMFFVALPGLLDGPNA